MNPQQVSLFDVLENGGTIERERLEFHNYQTIISTENLLASARVFLRGKRKRKDVAAFSLRFLEHVTLLHHELRDKSYRHGGYEAFKVNDPKPRDIHKASVRDRLVHHALYRTLYPYFDQRFIYDSYSCRFGKGTHKAIDHFCTFARVVSINHTRACWVLKCDIKKFFGSIDHTTLKNIIACHIADKNVLWLLGEIIDSFHSIDTQGVGLPLGNLTSQLLVNVYMNEFDQYVKRDLKIRHYIRYADDFVILAHTQKALEECITPISNFLQSSLKLTLHPKKLRIETLASGVDFLGWIHFPHHRVLRTSTKRRMFRRLQASAKRETLTSYLGLLSHGNTYTLKKKIYEPAFGRRGKSIKVSEG